MEAILKPIKHRQRQKRHFHPENGISLISEARNLVSLPMENTDSGTDRNITLVANGWTLIGYSADEPFYIEDAKFIASDGTNYSWSSAIAQNKVYGYMSYWDSSPSLARNRKYKYASINSLGMDDSNLQPKTGYWLWSKEAGKLNLPAVGGTLSTETFAWNKLRFHNGTNELNITEAGSEGWVTTTLKKYGDTGEVDRQGNPIYDFISVSSGNLYPWQGYFINSSIGSLILIRQN
jgi:hypothetical protein